MTAVPVVCCVKWGSKYPAHYVNRLRRMVGRHLASPHVFACMTEDASGLDPEIQIVPIPGGLEGYWNKISLFRDDIFEPGRTILYLDLDVVIVGELDFMLEGPPGFRICRNLGIKAGYNSSVMRIPAGELAFVHERFAGHARDIVESGRYVGDQDWIREQVPGASFFPDGKIVSYKKDLASHVFPLAKKLGLKYRWIRAPHAMTVEPPAGASVVVFHGKPDPEDVADAPYGPWKRAPFVKANWR